MPEPTLATPANMAKFAAENPGREIVSCGLTIHVEPRRAVALDRSTGETWSASASDYWLHLPDEPLTNADGDPLVLAVPVSGYVDALTGAEL